MASHQITASLPPRTPSLTSSDDTSASSEFDVPLKRSLPPLPLNGKAPVHSQILSIAGSRTSRTLSGILLSPQPSLAAALKHPQVLTRLLDQLPWVYFYTLTCTCRDFRYILQHPDLKDVVLSQYLPGYKIWIETRVMQRFKDVPTTITHLDLLLISQQLPLHKYPVHALVCTSALSLSSQQNKMTEKLESLTQAHSRFVLLLQSVVHSSYTPLSPEPAEYGLSTAASKTGLRQLTFPAPLSLSDEIDPKAIPEMMDALPVLYGQKRRNSAGGRLGGPSRPDTYLGGARRSPPSPTSTMSKRGPRRASILRGNLKPPPPPSAEPRSLKFYSATWRRHESTSYSAGSKSDDFLSRHPRPRFASVNVSTVSSLSPPPPTPLSCTLIDSSIRSSSPHDLHLALSRTRAPIVRVFVPSSDMSEEVIAACEEQLIESGLWEHLSAGDIICNLGFVLPTSEDNGSDSDDPLAASEHDANGNSAEKKWLLFDGYSLVPFSPPEPPPIDDPLMLPSPFYYSHITNPVSNQIYRLVFPSPDFTDAPRMTLVYTSSTVKSPHSPSGYAAVKKYMWVARVMVRTEFSHFGEGEAIGDGWKGEWVLEGDGTPEGRQVLIDCIKGSNMEKREWEFVREKSGGGRIWLKLQNTLTVSSPRGH